MVAPTKETIDPSTIVPPRKKLAESISEEVSSKTPLTPVVPDALSATVSAEASGASSPIALSTENEKFPHNLPHRLNIALGQDGKVYAVMDDAKNRYVLPVDSRKCRNIIRALGRYEGIMLRKADINEIIEYLQAHAEMTGVYIDVSHRVAAIPDGIVLDLGDEKHTQVRITAGKVEVITKDSDVLFYRTPVSKPMVMPAPVGNLKLLEKYLNLYPVDVVLFIAWASYTLAHPKASTTKYVTLVLLGDQGSGKTSLCTNVILPLIDPNIVGVQMLPSNSKDLAIAAQNAHVLCFDNVRAFKQSMADALCVASTGGALSSRKLYSDADQNILHLHVAVVLNGIHSFIDQPDLAQRCLPIRLKPFSEDDRKSDAVLVGELQRDLLAILRGMLDLIADVFQHLPTAEVTKPERMIEFVQWLAAMERAGSIPAGTYQTAYSHALRQAQLDSLLDHPLAAAVVELAERHNENVWSGTPAELLNKLNLAVTSGTHRSRDWPHNAISLSKRLAPLQAGLRSQGIDVQLGRGKHRRVTISRLEGYGNE